MTPAETIDLVEFVSSCCPQQKINELTPEAWHVLLADLDASDAIAACVSILRTQPFIAPSEIRARVTAELAAARPHSSLCRGRDCRDCKWSWCECTCHERNPVRAVPGLPAIRQAAPEPADAGQWASEARRLLEEKRDAQ